MKEKNTFIKRGKSKEEVDIGKNGWKDKREININ
jgi:hypothetical protein